MSLIVASAVGAGLDGPRPSDRTPRASVPGGRDPSEGGGPLQMALTTSGGVSLGAYQAGYLYYLVEVAKLNPQFFETRIITGSSAGTINALVAAIELGSELQSSPEQSLFYRLWQGMRIDELLDVKKAPPLALSSRAAFQTLAKMMEAEWNKGLSTDLDIVIGATATRVDSRQIPISKEFKVPRQEEKFVFRIQGRGRGLLPLVTNYVDATRGISQPLLPFVDPSDTEKQHTNFSVLTHLMFASSAFPLAFPSQEIAYCMSADDPDGVEVNAGDYAKEMACPDPDEKALFVDGSMFDRNPLGLAHRLVLSGVKQTDEGYALRDVPRKTLTRMPEDVVLLYVDALNEAYPPLPQSSDVRNVEALFPAFGSYSQGFVRSSQARGLHFLVDEYPEIKDRIELTRRHFPTASGLLANFFGFFDSKFRRFDFYLGMYDAHRYLKTDVTRALTRKARVEPVLHYPEMTESAQSLASWNPYFCMRHVFDGEARYRGTCDGDELRDFRALLQVSLHRLYDHCSALAYDDEMYHVHCLLAARGRRPPVVQPVPSGTLGDKWRRKYKETQFQYTMRLLEVYRFWFEELGLSREDAWQAMSRIREVLAGMLDDYAKKLPRAESIALRVIGKPALNFFKYQPPQLIVYAAAGKGAELGLSAAGKYSPSRWIRFNMGVQFKGLYEVLGPQSNRLTLTPLLGVEIENTRWASPVLQGRLGFRAGYQFSTKDQFMANACDVDKMVTDDQRCSAPVAQGFLVFTFYERIRIQGGVEWFPYFLPPMRETGNNVWNVFMEVGWQWISPFR